MSDKKKLIKSVSLGSLCGVLGCVILMCIFAVIMLTSGLLGAELTSARSAADLSRLSSITAPGWWSER